MRIILNEALAYRYYRHTILLELVIVIIIIIHLHEK